MSTHGFDDILVALGRPPGRAVTPPLRSSRLLAAVCRAGTQHIYADTADVEELRALVSTDGGVLLEVDGNTANQPLVHKVITRYLDDGEPATWAGQLRGAHPRPTPEQLRTALYAIVCGRLGNDAVRACAAGRAWAVSLQLHMQLGSDAEAAKRIGRCLRRMVPSGVVKVPFTPQHPHCFLVARDLEREGIPVNFTSTFSARQTVAAAMLANVTLTNIFMGRLNQGLKAALLGEHVDLAAQRALRQLRRDGISKTLLIVASVREWHTFVHVAGCDVFTAPCEAIHGFMTQTEVPADAVRSQLDTSYADRLGIPDELLRSVGAAHIARLYDVEPDLIRFLSELRTSRDYDAMRDGDALAKRFDQAGFGDLFYAPSPGEWTELRKNKLPDFDAPLSRRLPLDTLYTLLADADFEKFQAEMDGMIDTRMDA